MDKTKERLKEAFAYLKKEGMVRYQRDVADAMKINEVTVSRAFSGYEPYYNRQFVINFNAAFDNVFSLHWLLGEDAPMLNESKAEPAADERILSLAASLIKETEGLRRQLQAELDDIRDLKKELRDTIFTIRQVTTIQFPATSSNYLAERPSE